MTEAGLYTLTKIVAGGLSAVMTGPLGTTDLPDVDLAAQIAGNASGYAARVLDQEGSSLGYAGLGSGYSPSPLQLPDQFIQALLSVEDAHFGNHPGVDPVAVTSAAIDTALGQPRGGSTLTQQVVKNSVTGAELSLDRKVREAILAVRAQASMPAEKIIQGYLANAWFGRGQHGAAGASLAWFGKDWSEISLPEAALLAGLLKGPAYYDPIAHPERATARRDVVLRMMQACGMISGEDYAVATSMPLGVIPEEEAKTILDALPRWTASGIDRDFREFGLMNRSDIAEGDLEIVATQSRPWQRIAEEALAAGVAKIGAPGPVTSVALDGLRPGDPLDTAAVARLRQAAADALSTTQRSGRAIIVTADKVRAEVIIDRGYGPLEWDSVDLDAADLPFAPGPGDVMAYRRVDGAPVLEASPQVQGAVVVMDPDDGAILASVGGSDADLYPFDRTQAMRQPGSSIKPFLWARAMEAGLRWSDMVEDRERDYRTNTGDIWHPRNYDGTQSGLIPLFVGLEESSNLVAAHLISMIGVDAMAQVTELAGIYDWGKMRRHLSSALGASETSLTRLTAGYAAIANGGLVVTPHHISSLRRDGHEIWTPRGADESLAIASQATIQDLSSMLYGVTRRGTAYSAMKGLDLPVAGKTGTSQDWKDAWFMSFTPGIVVGVWVGRDDATTIPGHRSGSRAAGPIAHEIYQKALSAGLLTEEGLRPGEAAKQPWPPVLLDMNARGGPARVAGGAQSLPGSDTDPFKRPETTPGNMRPVAGLDSLLAQQEDNSAWFDQQDTAPSRPRGGYLDTTEDPGGIFTSPSREPASRTSDSNLIFKTPW